MGVDFGVDMGPTGQSVQQNDFSHKSPVDHLNDLGGGNGPGHPAASGQGQGVGGGDQPGLASGRGSASNPIPTPLVTVTAKAPVNTTTETPIEGVKAPPAGEGNSYTPGQRAAAIAAAQRSAPGGKLGGPIEMDSRINDGYKSIAGGTPDSIDREGHSGVTGKDYPLNTEADVTAANADIKSTRDDITAKGRVGGSSGGSSNR